MKYSLLIFSSLIFFGCTYKPENTEQSKFLKTLKGTIDFNFCKDKTYFRTCFQVTKDDCLKTVSDHYDSCLPKEVPKTITAMSSRKFGRALGACLSKKYGESLKEKGKFLGPENLACKAILEKPKASH